MTISLLIATTVYTLLNWNASHNLSRFYLNADSQQENLKAQKALALAHCPKSKLSESDCGILKEALQPQTKENMIVLVERITSASKRQSKTAGASRIQSAEVAARLIDYTLHNRDWHRPTPEIQELPEYGDFARTLRSAERDLVDYNQKNSLASRATLSTTTILRAQFLHAGWMHLIGNMVFFVLFAIAVEQRHGPLRTGAVYLLGGAFGLALHLMFASQATDTVLGASASVFAVAGMFMAAFWSLSMRVWVSGFFIFNTVTKVPVWMFFLFFIIMQELTGVAAGTGNVAHLAHLGGFAVGFLAAKGFEYLKPVPRPFVFPFEIDIYQATFEEENIEKKLSGLHRILFFNPENSEALREGWQLLISSLVPKWEELPQQAKLFLKHHLRQSLLTSVFTEDTHERDHMFAWLAQSHAPWPKLLETEEALHLIHRSRIAVDQGRRGEAQVLLNIALATDPSGTSWNLNRPLVQHLSKELSDAVAATGT